MHLYEQKSIQTINLFFIIFQQFQKSLAGGYIWKVPLFSSQHIQVAILKLLRFHLRGNLLLPFVLCVINGPYYFQRDPLAAVTEEQLEIWLYGSLSWTHPFTFDIYTGCGFLCNSLESSLNLKKVLVFLEPSGKGKSFIGLKCLELKPVLVWLENVSGNRFCYFSKLGCRDRAEGITNQEDFFFPSKSWELKEMTAVFKILLFPLWMISVQLRWTIPIGPHPDFMGTEIRKSYGQNSHCTNCFQFKNLKVLDKSMISCHILFFHRGDWSIIH